MILASEPFAFVKVYSSTGWPSGVLPHKLFVLAAGTAGVSREEQPNSAIASASVDMRRVLALDLSIICLRSMFPEEMFVEQLLRYRRGARVHRERLASRLRDLFQHHRVVSRLGHG